MAKVQGAKRSVVTRDLERGRDGQIGEAQGIFRAVKLSTGKAGFRRRVKRISFTCASQN